MYKLPYGAPHTQWQRFGWSLYESVRQNTPENAIGKVVRRAAHFAADPADMIMKAYDQEMGIEDFHFPASRLALTLPEHTPEIVHCHNLHGNYFDLTWLPELSKQLPVILTLQDMWTLTGHCAYALDCGRWETGCGKCPDLNRYPAKKRDATAYNWKRKRDIYSRSKLYICAASQWLMDQVNKSMLLPAAVEQRVIVNGADLATFHPGDKMAARRALDLPEDHIILLASGGGFRTNMWKDYNTLRASLDILSMRLPETKITCVIVGETGEPEKSGHITVRFEPFRRDMERMARFYQSADIYTHSSRAEVFSLAVLEALACGLPVVASNVGGTPEQLLPLQKPGGDAFVDQDRATGILTIPSDPKDFARAVELLIKAPELRAQIADNAARDAAARFGFDRVVNESLSWYEEILERRRAESIKN